MVINSCPFVTLPQFNIGNNGYVAPIELKSRCGGILYDRKEGVEGGRGSWKWAKTFVFCIRGSWMYVLAVIVLPLKIKRKNIGVKTIECTARTYIQTKVLTQFYDPLLLLYGYQESPSPPLSEYFSNFGRFYKIRISFIH